MKAFTHHRVRIMPVVAAASLLCGVVLGLSSTAEALPVGTITTVAGTGAVGFGPWPGAATSGALNSPHGLAYDPNNDSVLISDTTNCDVLEESLATHTIQVVVNIAAACGAPSPAGTPAPAAQLDHPHGLAVDQAHNLLYIADRDNHVLDVVNLTTMVMENFIPIFPGAPICTPVGLSVDQTTSTVYVADDSCQVVWQIPFGGFPSVFAGTFNSAGFSGNGGPPLSAHLYEPNGVAYDSATSSLYVADTFNNEIRKVASGVITDFIGSPVATPGFSPDGSPATSPINMPHAVRLDGAGNVFYDETGNNLVREVGSSGTLLTIAGSVPPGIPFPYSGNPATTVALNSPHGLAIVPTSPTTGDVWFSDTNNNVVDSVTGVAAGAGSDEGDNVACIPDPAGVGQCPNPPSQPGGLDHYLCYHVADDSGFVPPSVSLTDQFGTDSSVLPSTAPGPSVTDDSQMCNPVTKTLPSGVSYPVQNPYLHQLCFPDTRTTPSVQVSVQNQFGTGDLTVGAATRLCVPSWKYDPNDPGIMPGSVPSPWPSAVPPTETGIEDHYQCYSVSAVAGATNFANKPATITLKDQFGTDQSVAIGDPVEICAPVNKTVLSTGQSYHASNLSGAHLLCYAVNVADPLGAVRNVLMGNQFSPPATTPGPTPEQVTVTFADQLCLPSFKSILPNPGTPEAPVALMLPLAALIVGVPVLLVVRRRGRRVTALA